jgi:uncharacterized glyoxalase superfamily protein PhnB
MDARLSFVTLGVGDPDVAARFYEDTFDLKRRPSPDGVVFLGMGSVRLALYPRVALAAVGGLDSHAMPGAVMPPMLLSCNVGSAELVRAVLARATAAGAVVTRAPGLLEWGGYGGFFTDLDGWLWEVAWNPDAGNRIENDLPPAP